MMQNDPGTRRQPEVVRKTIRSVQKRWCLVWSRSDVQRWLNHVTYRKM